MYSSRNSRVAVLLISFACPRGWGALRAVSTVWSRFVYQRAQRWAQAHTLPNLLESLGDAAVSSCDPWLLGSLTRLNHVTLLCPHRMQPSLYTVRIPLHLKASRRVRCLLVCLNSLDPAATGCDDVAQIRRMRIGVDACILCAWMPARFFTLISFYKYWSCQAQHPVLLYSTCLDLRDQQEAGMCAPQAGQTLWIEVETYTTLCDARRSVAIDVVGGIA